MTSFPLPRVVFESEHYRVTRTNTQPETYVIETSDGKDATGSTRWREYMFSDPIANNVISQMGRKLCELGTELQSMYDLERGRR